MERELLTFPMTAAQLRDELVFTVAQLRDSGFTACDVTFGWAWGIAYYPGDRWVAEPVPLDSLLAKLAEVESRGIGRLGADDLFLEFPTFSLHFCHESDVHLGFDEHFDLVEVFFARWQRLGYQPAEWCSSDGKRRVRVRGGDMNASLVAAPDLRRPASSDSAGT